MDAKSVSLMPKRTCGYCGAKALNVCTRNDAAKICSIRDALLEEKDTPPAPVKSDAVVNSDGGTTDYYNLPEDVKDLQDLIEYKEMNFSIGNIFKACYRYGQKNSIDAAYDLRKMIWFAERELKRIQK